MGRFFTTESLGKPHLPSERPKWERLEIYSQDLRAINNIYGTSLVAQWLRIHLPIQKTWIWSQGQKDPLEEKMETYSSILAWKIPWAEEPGGLQSMGPQRVTHNWVSTHTRTCIFIPCNFLTLICKVYRCNLIIFIAFHCHVTCSNRCQTPSVSSGEGWEILNMRCLLGTLWCQVSGVVCSSL